MVGGGSRLGVLSEGNNSEQAYLSYKETFSLKNGLYLGKNPKDGLGVWPKSQPAVKIYILKIALCAH